MAYDEFLADRIRRVFSDRKIRAREKKMMGGLTFMVNDKMCVGIVKYDLMARIDPTIFEQALTRTGCRTMDFTGRTMRGFVFVSPEGTDSDKDLEYWVDLALEYNPKAKSSKKSKKQ